MKKAIILGVALAVLSLSACATSKQEATQNKSSVVEGKTEVTNKVAESTKKKTGQKYLSAGLTIGDETIYVNECTYKELVKFLQKDGYEGNVDLVKEVEPGEVVEVTLGKVYNNSEHTKKLGDCKICRLYINMGYDKLSILDGTINKTSTKEQVISKLSELGYTGDFTSSIRIEDKLPTGQYITMWINAGPDGVYSVGIDVPQLLE